VTVLLAGEPEAERDAIASGMLGSLSGLVLVHAEANVESILGVARGSGPKAVVIDLADGSAERLALLTALRQQAARLRIIALGGDEAAARAAGVTAHLSRPLDRQRLAEVVRDAVLQSYRDQA
jgi:DNA-binding NtrC family response regulator